MVSEEFVFGSSDVFKITAVDRREDQVIVSVQSGKTQGTCPACQVNSQKLHSYYKRKIKDLPAFDQKVSLHVRAKKWYCANIACTRKIFTERFDHYVQRYKRFSERLREKMLNISLLMGGNAGERLCRTLSIAASSSTLLRLVHSQPLPEQTTSFAVGIDDWAFRKGSHYGTVVVDLEQHKIVDLLPDREAQTVENYLKGKPHVRIVTRDRFGPYATGVTNGLAEATQVADRWHLLKNMGDALQTLLERKRQEIIAAQRSALEKAMKVEGKAPVETEVTARPLSPRQELFQRVKGLHADGRPLRAIAKALTISRNTVKKYIHLQELPRKKGHKATNLLTYNNYLQTRMLEDEDVEVLQLFKEIKAQGYTGGRTTLYEYLNGYGKQRGSQRSVKLPEISWTAAKVKMLLCKKEEDLPEKDKVLVQDICEKSQDVQEARRLALQFRDIMEKKQGHLLKSWISEVVASPLRELKGFAQGLLSDYQAVENALTLPWSNGQVEGQINKLKTIKRQMYGRASFELLRKRMILSTPLYHQN